MKKLLISILFVLFTPTLPLLAEDGTVTAPIVRESITKWQLTGLTISRGVASPARAEIQISYLSDSGAVIETVTAPAVGADFDDLIVYIMTAQSGEPSGTTTAAKKGRFLFRVKRFVIDKNLITNLN